MFGHVSETANPVVGIEFRVSPPAITVVTGAAPLSTRYVVVKIHIYLLRGELRDDGIKDLHLFVSGRYSSAAMSDIPRGAGLTL
jgi:hypothetical protein